MKALDITVLRSQFLCLLMVVSLFTFSCGSKAMPLPCEHVSLESINNLQYYIDSDGLVFLSWSVCRLPVEDQFCGGVLAISISEEPLDGEFCPSCPVNFLRTVEVPVDNTLVWGEDMLFVSYVDKIVNNYRYFYKLMIISKDNSIDFESDVVQFEYCDDSL